jgi:hypothetical protein
MSIAAVWLTTTPEVYFAIYNQHQGELTVHESCTQMDEGPYMLTSWGFRDADAPLIQCVRRGDDYDYFIACHASEA